MHIHTLNIILEAAGQGENTYTCSTCSQPVVLVWNSYTNAEGFHATNWGPRNVDTNDESITNATINYL